MTLKLPDFWESAPQLWFVSVEAQFFVANVTSDEAMFCYVIAKLDRPALLNQVLDIVAHPPAENKYTTLRARLLARFGESDESKFQKLLGAELGDTKPSLLLAEMRQTASVFGIPDATVKMMFLQRLPKHISRVLTISSQHLDEIGRYADRMMAIDCQGSVNQVTEDESELKKQVDALTAAVQKLNVRGRDRNQRRSQPERQSDDVCWFHRTYGERARKCRPPCNYRPKN